MTKQLWVLCAVTSKKLHKHAWRRELLCYESESALHQSDTETAFKEFGYSYGKTMLFSLF